MTVEMVRIDGRRAEELRPVKFTPNYLAYAEGSCMIEFGNTKVLCAATIDNKTAPHLKDTGQGWITAEYSLLPRSTQQRTMRNAVKGHISGRTYEIQRVIGRALRSVVNLQSLGERTIILDCDVLQADGGTRTAAITGSFVAVALALQKLLQQGKIAKLPLTDYVAAVSVGIVEGQAVVDLCYLEDTQAGVDMNVVMTGAGKFVEIQGTAEHSPFSFEQMHRLINLAEIGIKRLIHLQKEIIHLPGL